jgi:hypothetical protein
MAHYELYVCLTKAVYESAVPSVLQPKLGWNNYTYTETERTGTRMVNKYDYFPSEDNTVAEIKAYMDDASVDYASGDTKAELLEKLFDSVHDTPQVEESYTYIEQEIDTTTAYTPTWKESAFKGNLGAPRTSLDGNLIVVKGEFSLRTGELSAIIDLGSGMAYPNNSVLTKSEAQTLVSGELFTE